MKRLDLVGQRFGRLLVIALHGLKPRVRWACACDCGRSTTGTTTHLRSGHKQSCGCLAVELTTARNSAGARHGMSSSPEYQAWRSMLKRCYVPTTHAFGRYGGRGIEVCQAWQDSFEAFFADMGPRPSAAHSLDRERNGEGYKPGNVRWATDVQQNNNRRSNVTACIDGEVLTAAQIAERFGLNHGTVIYRIKSGKREADIIAPSRRAA